MPKHASSNPRLDIQLGVLWSPLCLAREFETVGLDRFGPLGHELAYSSLFTSIYSRPRPKGWDRYSLYLAVLGALGGHCQVDTLSLACGNILVRNVVGYWCSFTW